MRFEKTYDGGQNGAGGSGTAKDADAVFGYNENDREPIAAHHPPNDGQGLLMPNA